jgi:hypothetical protein
MPSSDVSTRGARRPYVVIAVLLALWAAVLLALALTVIPDTYWYSYYAIDYTVGFVRRGLGGELVGLLPGQNYFVEQQIGRWVSSGAYIIGLVGLAWWVAAKSGRSERRTQLAFLVVVLPFGFAFGLLQAGSTLFGGAALAALAIALVAARSDRSVFIASAVYGIVTAVATLVHEAIPLLYGLGVIVALIVLANQLSRKAFWASFSLALGPGLVTALVVAAFGRRGVSQELCELIPNGQVNNPLAGNPSTGQLLTGYTYYVDYQDWACRNITPFYDRDLIDALRYVGRLGAAGMIVNSAFGVGIVVITLLAIRWVSGVPFTRIRTMLAQRWSAVVIGVFLILPVFMTGIDWVRWWVVVSFDIGVVYLLYASSQPEVDLPPTRRSMRAFIVIVIALTLIPVGIVPAFLAPLPI